MQSIDEIRITVYSLGALINAPKNSLHLLDRPVGDGTPHVEIFGEEYHYVSTERGIENLRKKTSSIDKLLYWIFSDVTSFMSFSYELAHRVPNQDFRRLVFSKQFELLEALNPAWAEIEKKRIGEILHHNPYDDDIDKRVTLCKKLTSKGYSAEDSYEKACMKYPLPER